MKKAAENSSVWLPALVVFLLLVEMGLGQRIVRHDSVTLAAHPGVSRLAGIHFAIADFDGDWKPDVAIVETANLHRVRGNYAVHVQFSGAAEISFLVSAPNGGIRLAARDVNGDNLPDLVVSSVLDQSVVAILLNQGHGQFSRAEPSSYLGFSKQLDIFLRGHEQSLTDKFTVASLRYSFEGERVGGSTNPSLLAADSVVVAESSLQSGTKLRSRRGRSPPCAVFLV